MRDALLFASRRSLGNNRHELAAPAPRIFLRQLAAAAHRGNMRFQTVLVVTASHEQQSQAVEIELAARQRDGLLDPDILTFAIPDPSAARVGSGGATFNALLTSKAE